MKKLFNKPDDADKIERETIYQTDIKSSAKLLNITLQYYVIKYVKKFVNFITNKKNAG